MVSIDKHWNDVYLVGEVRVCSPLQEQCHNIAITPVGCLVQSSAIVLEGKHTYKFGSGQVRSIVDSSESLYCRGELSGSTSASFFQLTSAPFLIAAATSVRLSRLAASNSFCSCGRQGTILFRRKLESRRSRSGYCRRTTEAASLPVDRRWMTFRIEFIVISTRKSYRISADNNITVVKNFMLTIIIIRKIFMGPYLYIPNKAKDTTERMLTDCLKRKTSPTLL